MEEHRIAGAGVDAAGSDHPRGKERELPPGVLSTSRRGGQSAEARERQWRLFRENVRRFAAGEPLLCVVERDGDS
jgi:hypothetical protein